VDLPRDHARRFEVFQGDAKLVEGTWHTNGLVTSCWVGDTESVAVFPGGWPSFERVSLGDAGGRHPEHAQRRLLWLD
jgi:hypothetical protein